jgi:hypothetical protein
VLVAIACVGCAVVIGGAAQEIADAQLLFSCVAIGSVRPRPEGQGDGFAGDQR